MNPLVAKPGSPGSLSIGEDSPDCWGLSGGFISFLYLNLGKRVKLSRRMLQLSSSSFGWGGTGAKNGREGGAPAGC